MLHIDTTSVLRGSFTAAGRVQLNSWFEGDILCSRLDIGRDGYVKGNITARELHVEGQIVGTVHAGIVHLMEGSFVEGDVHHHVLSLHPTASLMGTALRSTRMPFPQELLALEARSETVASRFPVSVGNTGSTRQRPRTAIDAIAASLSEV
jgi:cytoskeletal protein CcmA (bactofilin family)